MYRVFCNDCYGLYNKNKMFSLTSCGHVYCSDCLPHGNRIHCRICKRKFTKMAIGKSMPERTQTLFGDLKKNIAIFNKVFQFQSQQNEYYVQHLIKENARQKRLLSCFKKRIEFLVKNSSKHITRQMYSKIKQEPIDDGYVDFSELKIDSKNDEIYNDQFSNIDWNSDIDECDSKTRQYINNTEFVPQFISQKLPDSDENVPQLDLRKMEKNVSLENLVHFAKKRDIVLNETKNDDDKKPFRYQPGLFSLNHDNGPEKVSQPQVPSHQATIDQFLSRKNNFINGVGSSDYSLKNQSRGPTGNVNYPNTVLTTRPIDAKTLSNIFQ